jgi:hypothetical protein
MTISPQNVLIGHDKILKWNKALMFQTLSPHAGDAIHPVLLGRVWLVRLMEGGHEMNKYYSHWPAGAQE